MANRILYRTNEFPYHITARANNKEWFGLPMDTAWEVFEWYLNLTIKRYEFRVHDFLLMSNHYHMNATTPLPNIDVGMRYFQTETARSIARETGRINRIWGARYKPSVITSAAGYGHAYKYLYRNPVAAGIVEKVEDYPWSTLNIGKSKSKIEVVRNEGFDCLIPDDPDQLLLWLSEPGPREYNEAIRKAIRRREFKLPVSKRTGMRENFCHFLPKEKVKK